MPRIIRILLTPEQLAGRLPIDIDGTWSHRQAEKVCEALAERAEELGMRLSIIDITSHSSRYPKAIIVAHLVRLS